VSAVFDKVKPSFDEDVVFVDRFLAGDGSAFEHLYSKYYEKVFAIARGILLDAEEAADAVQEVFTLVYRNLPRFDRRSKFSTWLFRVSVNRIIQQARKVKYKARHVDLEAAAATEVERPEDGDPRVEIAMSELAPADRAILTLFYWEELSLQEIADSLDCNVNAAKTRLYRARERFRVVFEKTS
jgi:RNA polymerase sigma-70 factor (ECF subfamily)